MRTIKVTRKPRTKINDTKLIKILIANLNIDYNVALEIFEYCGNELLNPYGKITKRIRKSCRKVGLGVSDNDISAIGKAIEQNTRTTEIEFNLLDDTAIERDKFYDDDSCFFSNTKTGRTYCRRNIEKLKGFACTINKNSKPFGRFWLIPIEEDGFILFNLYCKGDSYELSLIADLLGKALNYSELRTVYYDDSIEHYIYMNSGTVWYIGNNPDFDHFHFPKGRFTTSHKWYTCESCGHLIDSQKIDYCPICDREVEGNIRCCSCRDRVDDDYTEVDGQIYCSQCFNEHFTYCSSCNEIIDFDSCYCVSDSCYCESCYVENYTCCNECNEDVYREDAITIDGLSYCEYCADKYFVKCEHCEEYFKSEDITTTEDNYSYCSKCLEEVDNCDVCGNKTGNAIVHNGSVYCADCFDDANIGCKFCGKNLTSDSFTKLTSSVICHNCWESLKDRRTELHNEIKIANERISRIFSLLVGYSGKDGNLKFVKNEVTYNSNSKKLLIRDLENNYTGWLSYRENEIDLTDIPVRISESRESRILKNRLVGLTQEIDRKYLIWNKLVA